MLTRFGSQDGPITTSAGAITPLTLERFRICEFYAELLHCSNMSLLNRPTDAKSLYDSEGFLAQGWRAGDELADALAGPPLEDDEDDRDARLPSSSDMSVDSSTGPIDLPTSYSGTSTPSGHGSLDSESGILTRAEAKELRDVLAAAASEDNEGEEAEQEEEKDPFGDPEDAGSDVDLAEATKGIALDDDLQSKQPATEDDEEEEEGKREGEAIPAPPTARLSPTPSPARAPPPGQLLKRRFMEHHVIETMLVSRFSGPFQSELTSF